MGGFLFKEGSCFASVDARMKVRAQFQGIIFSIIVELFFKA